MLKLNTKSALIIASYLNILLPHVLNVLGGLNGIHQLRTVSTSYESQSEQTQCTALQKVPFLFWKETGTGLSEQPKHAVSNLLKDCIRGLLCRTLGRSQISFESRQSGIRNLLPSPFQMFLGPVEIRGNVLICPSVHFFICTVGLRLCRELVHSNTDQRTSTNHFFQNGNVALILGGSTDSWTFQGCSNMFV